MYSDLARRGPEAQPIFYTYIYIYIYIYVYIYIYASVDLCISMHISSPVEALEHVIAFSVAFGFSHKRGEKSAVTHFF